MTQVAPPIVGLEAYRMTRHDSVRSTRMSREEIHHIGHDLYQREVVHQNDEPLPAHGPDRRDNLFEPVPGDHEAHGRFDAQAHDASPLLS